MACSKCKKKREREEILKEIETTEKYVKIFFLVILGLALYGIYSIFSFLLK